MIPEYSFLVFIKTLHTAHVHTLGYIWSILLLLVLQYGNPLLELGLFL